MNSFAIGQLQSHGELVSSENRLIRTQTSENIWLNSIISANIARNSFNFNSSFVVNDVSTKTEIIETLNAAKRDEWTNVNWSFLKNIADRLEVLLTDKHPELAKLFNLRSCALHVAHGAFETGCTKAGFDCRKVLKSGSSHLITSLKTTQQKKEFPEIKNYDLNYFQ